MPDADTCRLPRRALTAGLAGLLASGGARPAAAVVPPGGYHFRILREGRAIGTHRVAVEITADRLVARTAVDVEVRLLGVTVYRLTHRFEEIWQGERLVVAASEFVRNGRRVDLRVQQEAGGLHATGTAGAHRLPGDAAPLTWWDSRRLTRPQFDAETGAPLALRLTRQPLPGGGALWQASDATEAAGRYAADGTWLAWRTVAEDKSVVTYEPG